MLNKELIVNEIIRLGAAKAQVIENKDIVLSSVFRNICAKNACGMYGKSYMCPPAIGEINELMSKIRTFPFGILYQSIFEIEDSFDFEGMMDAGKKHEELTIHIQKAINSILNCNYLHLGSGGCRICDECAILRDEPCLYPELALAPIEGYGVNVSETCKNTKLKYINGENTVTYFGLLLLEE